MRIRQIALVAADLEATLETITDVLGIDVAFRDPGVGVFGLANGVMPIGDTFLEVVSPVRDDASAARYLERRGGDGGYMVIFQTSALAAERTRLAGLGVRIVWEIAFPDIETAHIHPRDTGGAIVSLDEARPYDEWRWAGPSWRQHRRTDRVTAIRGVEIQSHAPQALAERWTQLFSLRPGRDASTRALDDGGEIRFVDASDGRGEGIRSVTLATADRDAVATAALRRGLAVEGDLTPQRHSSDGEVAVTLCGVRFVLG